MIMFSDNVFDIIKLKRCMICTLYARVCQYRGHIHGKKRPRFDSYKDNTSTDEGLTHSWLFQLG